MDEHTATMSLTAAYMAEVESRGMKMMDSEIMDQIEDVARWLIDPNKKPFLILAGKVGNGKTTMAKAIKSLVNLMVETYEAIPLTEARMKYVSSKELTESAQIDNGNMYVQLKSQPMLIIDDLGTESAEVKVYGNILSPITDTLYARYNGMSLTIITTNLTVSEIEERYGSRLRDRFREVAHKVTFKGDSYRGRKAI